jgi:uncharacterized membrane protein
MSIQEIFQTASEQRAPRQHMTTTAIILLLISAFLHAGWNLLGKRYSPTAAGFLPATVAGMLCLTPIVIIYKETLRYFTGQCWWLVLATGACQTVYYAALAGAYKTGDMSIAYPLARSSPVIVVTVVSIFLGKADQISRQCVYGIILVVLGGFLLPMRRFNNFRVDNYLNVTCLLALLAACGTTGYSIIDDEALRLLRHTPNATLQVWQITLVYTFFEALTSSFWLTLLVLGRKQERHRFRNIITTRPGSAALMGVWIYLTYSLVLISMAFVANVSYVVAFRQLSIPLGVIMSVSILKEPAYVPKFVAVAVMFIGLVLVGTG